MPVVAVGGERAQGDRVREMVSLVASDVRGETLPGCGHFLPEERPQEIFGMIMELPTRLRRSTRHDPSAS